MRSSGTWSFWAGGHPSLATGGHGRPLASPTDLGKGQALAAEPAGLAGNRQIDIVAHAEGLHRTFSGHLPAKAEVFRREPAGFRRRTGFGDLRAGLQSGGGFESARVLLRRPGGRWVCGSPPRLPCPRFMAVWLPACGQAVRSPGTTRPRFLRAPSTWKGRSLGPHRSLGITRCADLTRSPHVRQIHVFSEAPLDHPGRCRPDP